MPRSEWTAQQAKQGAEWEAIQNDWCCRKTARQGNGVADDMVEGRARTGRRVRQRAEVCVCVLVNAKARREAGTNGV